MTSSDFLSLLKTGSPTELRSLLAKLAGQQDPKDVLPLSTNDQIKGKCCCDYWCWGCKLWSLFIMLQLYQLNNLPNPQDFY